MKKSAKKSTSKTKRQTSKKLHPSQKLLIRRYILRYYLFTSILDSKNNNQKEVASNKDNAEIKKAEDIPVWEELAPVLREEPEEVSRSTERPKAHVKAKHFIHYHITKQGFKKVILSAAIILIVVVVIQLLYPSNRALPLSRLQSQGFMGGSSKDQILKSFEDFDSRIVTIHTHTKTLTTSYKDLGVTVEPFQTVEEMTNYAIKDRLIPFSILFNGNKEHEIKRDINESQLNLYVKDVIAQASKQPVDATVVLDSIKFKITPSEEGYRYQKEVLKSQILRSDLKNQSQIVFAPTILYPGISTDLAQSVVNIMQSRINQPITINAEGKSLDINSETIASWVKILPKSDDNQLEIVFDKAKIANSLRPLTNLVDRPQQPTVITYLNSSQVGRSIGKVGKALQFENLVDRVADLRIPSISTIEASVVTIPSEEVIDRRYTKDNVGLQSLLDYWTANNPGEYGVDIRSLNGQLSASKNSFDLFPSVGVYRSFIASLIYGRINAGTLSQSTQVITGQTVDACMSLMLRQSNDQCTTALGSLVGWSANDDLLKSQGFENTTLSQNTSLTTANDSADWLVKLAKNEIATFAHSNAIIDHMHNHIYRSGIPSGVSGSSVANRSGSFGRLNNDIGVVYNSAGTYVVSILSEGSSFEHIANLASQIDQVMSQ